MSTQKSFTSRTSLHLPCTNPIPAWHCETHLPIWYWYTVQIASTLVVCFIYVPEEGTVDIIWKKNLN